MKATPPRVGCIGLLDRLLVAARAPADSFLLASCRNLQAVSNARHHAPAGPIAFDDAIRVAGRVHADVRPLMSAGMKPPEFAARRVQAT